MHNQSLRRWFSFLFGGGELVCLVRESYRRGRVLDRRVRVVGSLREGGGRLRPSSAPPPQLQRISLSISSQSSSSDDVALTGATARALFLHLAQPRTKPKLYLLGGAYKGVARRNASTSTAGPPSPPLHG